MTINLNKYLIINHFARSTHTELGQMPPPQALQRVTEYSQSTGQGTSSLYLSNIRSSIGAGLPPVPEKLVSRIEAGEFIEMAELLPDHMGTAGMRTGDDQSRVLRSRRKVVTNILEWVECFAIYIAVISRKQPHRVPEMLGYLILILEAQMEYVGDGWLGYDRRFRMAAAGNPSINWAVIDTTLWNLAFSGKARSSRCKHCFSLSHLSRDCEWGPEPSGVTPTGVSHPVFARTLICYDWNNNRKPGCPRTTCNYEHICSSCAFDPNIPDKVHKLVYCPYKQLRGQSGSRWNMPR